MTSADSGQINSIGFSVSSRVVLPTRPISGSVGGAQSQFGVDIGEQSSSVPLSAPLSPATDKRTNLPLVVVRLQVLQPVTSGLEGQICHRTARKIPAR